MTRGTLSGMTFMLAFVLAPGALATPDLALDIAYPEPAAAEILGPALAVTFVDGRGEDLGGGDPASFGVLRSSVTRRIVHAGGLEIGEFVNGYVVSALRAAGYDARSGDDPTLPRLRITLRTMMATGFTQIEVPIEARLELVPTGASAPSWADTLAVSGRVTLDSGPEELAGAFGQALTAGLSSLDAHFRAAPFLAAMGVERTAAVPAGETDGPAAVVSPPPPPAPPAPMAGVPPIERITDASEKEASQLLASLCQTHFTVEFEFLAEEDDSEWTVTFIDEDGDEVGYVNLDDEETVEFDGDDEELDEEADAGETHRVVIRVEDDEVTLHIDGEEVLDDEDLEDYDECLHLAVKVDDDMVLSGFRVAVIVP